jgi:copper chaperone CopZ
MKTTVINLEGIESVLSPAGVEKQLCKRSGIHRVETNFMTGTATVSHDESVTLTDIKRAVAECGYGSSAECMPEYVCKPGHRAPAVDAPHVMPVAPGRHAEHKIAADDTAAMAHEMGTPGAWA